MSALLHPGGRADPSLGFWLRYVESNGALTEDDGERVVVVLPGSLQESLGLTEEVAVTSDPEIAREDGALLLLPGHPVLEHAAASVLEGGDVGHAHLPWPSGPPISPSSLVERLREQLVVDHGRVGVAGQPVAGYLPVLRVGALLSYAVSLEQRFEEREEVLVDAVHASRLAEVTAGVLRRRALEAGAPADRPILAWEPSRAVSAAHLLLVRRAEARRRELATQAGHLLAEEIERADAYYRAALESIEHRAERADPERRALLQARADATRAEAARRRDELVERHEATYEVRPFRLHLLALPAQSLAVEVSRGQRTYTSSAIFLLPPFGSILVPSCPGCGSSATLVAGKERLGCRRCLAPVAPAPASPAPPAAPVAPVSPAPASPAPPAAPVAPARPAPSSRKAPATPPSPVARAMPSSRKAPATPPSPVARAMPPSRKAPATPPSPSGRVDRNATEEPSPSGRRIRPGSTRRSTSGAAGGSQLSAVGERLVMAIWQAVGDRSTGSYDVAAHSPFEAWLRLYGPAGPARAIGMLPNEVPGRLFSLTIPSRTFEPHVSVGDLLSRQATYRFAVSWRLSGGKAVVGEVLPTAGLLANPQDLGSLPDPVRTRLGTGSPMPAQALDPVADALFAMHDLLGLPVVVRALAIWWWLAGEMDDDLTSAVENLEPADAAGLVVAVIDRRASELPSSRRARSGRPGSGAARRGELQGRLFDLGDVGERVMSFASGAPALRW